MSCLTTLPTIPGNSHRIDRTRRRRHIAAEECSPCLCRCRPVPERADPRQRQRRSVVGSYLVVTFNPASAALPDRERRCAAASQLRRALTKAPALYRVHSYPVTPYHMDYLHHFDAIDAAGQAHLDRAAADTGLVGSRLNVQARVNSPKRSYQRAGAPQTTLGTPCWKRSTLVRLCRKTSPIRTAGRVPCGSKKAGTMHIAC